jgi:hypothetical protein
LFFKFEMFTSQPVLAVRCIPNAVATNDETTVCLIVMYNIYSAVITCLSGGAVQVAILNTVLPACTAKVYRAASTVVTVVPKMAVALNVVDAVADVDVAVSAAVAGLYRSSVREPHRFAVLSERGVMS